MLIRLSKFIVVLSLISACEYYPQDCEVEESIEEMIERETNYNIDLSPLSPEPHV